MFQNHDFFLTFGLLNCSLINYVYFLFDDRAIFQGYLNINAYKLFLF